MDTKKLTRTLKALIALAMVQSPLLPEAAAAGAACKAKESCDRLVRQGTDQGVAISSLAGQTSAGSGQNGLAGGLGGAALGTANVACGVKQKCEEFKKQCEKDKKTCQPKDCQDIEETINGVAAQCAQAMGVAADAGKTQAAASGGGGGNQMMGMIAGAAMGALAAMAMQKKDKKQDDQMLPVDPNAAWNGVQLDCSKMDAHAYQACNQQMEVKCASQMDEATCLQFEARYCSGQGTGAMAPPVAPPMPPQIDPSTGAIIGMPAYGQPGEGIGTQFCQNNIAYNFCKAPGRADCPSCLRLQRNASAVCTQDPAACLASNSAAQMQNAAQTCPTDPAFADPSWAASAGVPTAPAIATNGPAATVGAGGPAVILMQSMNGTASSSGALNGAAPASAGEALREGRAAEFAGANGTASASGSGSTFVPSGAHGSRELASGGGNYRPASAGPSSDVQAQYSQSLFVTSSQVIRNRCNSGRLNCP